MPVRLTELLAPIPEGFWAEIPALPADLEIGGLSLDSRRTEPGDLFCALTGAHADGNDYIAEALSRGAAALLLEGERPLPAGCCANVLRANSARQVMALLAGLFWGEPSRDLRVIGITGTDGKTSTSWIVRHLLASIGRRAVAAGTLGICTQDASTLSWGAAGAQDAARTWHPTTPEAPLFQATLARLRDEGIEDVVAEVSSHALSQERVFGTQFAVVALTHVSADHLDFHGSHDAYQAAKARLFNPATRGGPLERSAVIEVLNCEDQLGRMLARSRRQVAVTYGHAPEHDIALHGIAYGSKGMTLELSIAGARESVTCELTGRFHAENLLAAAAIGHALGLPREAITRGLATAPIIPGRFEPIRAGQPYAVIVDYAHTADALARLLEAVRETAPARIILVFGCGGDRDASKRIAMGRVAGQGADLVLITTDNPRSEDPARIAAEVARGLKGAAATWKIVLGRREALTEALALAETGDAVVIAGKGAETEQVFADRVEVFDDRAQLHTLLEQNILGRTAE